MPHRNSIENSYPPIEVHVTRGNFTESVHLVDAVVVDATGKVVASFGRGENKLTYPRSAIKALQAVSFVESGAYQAYDLTNRHLSIACASHNGEKAHTDLVMEWLGKVGFAEDDLVCGPHYPYNEPTARELIRHDQSPCKRHNNCSGKHTGILSTLKKLGWDHHDYGSYDHNLQVRFRKILTELTGESMDDAPWGVDGCGIPTYAMSLVAMARGMRHLLPDQPLPAERKETFRLIREAVLSEPYYIGGASDFCTDTMTLTQGRLFLKAGAEGVYSAVLMNQGLSFGLKAIDGNPRAARVAASALLKTFQGLTESEFLQLSSHTEPVVKNWSGQTVGKIFVPVPLMG